MNQTVAVPNIISMMPVGGELPQGKFRQVSVSELKEAPINESLYHPPSIDDPEFQDFVENIRKNNGPLVALAISEDNYIISGHRRKSACELLGIEAVRCEVHPIRSDDPSFDVYVRDFNRQRVKTLDEIIREAVVDATADELEIGRNLQMDRIRKSRISVQPMEIEGCKTRAQIKGNRPLLDAAIKIIYELEEFWPLSDRGVHYVLLNDPPLKHRGKPDSTYINDRKSYQLLTNVLTRGRLIGEVPWEAIADETRPMIMWNVWKNISPFVEKQFDRFMKGYFRDYLQSQPNHIEIAGEKVTLQGIIRPVAEKYCLPCTLGKGYASIPPRHDMAERFAKSGKEKLIVLLLSDFDPDGLEISQSFARSMRDDFGIDNICPIRVALDYEQVISLNLPHGEKAKKGERTKKDGTKEESKKYRKFVDKYGEYVFELEAVRPEILQDLLDTAIRSIIDVDLFNGEKEQEEKEFLELGRYRKKVLEIIRNDPKV